MSKRRFSDVATTVFLVHKQRHPQRRGSCRAYSTFASTSPHPSLEDGVRQDVQIMVAGTAGALSDDLIKTTLSSDLFLQQEPLSPRADPARSRSSSIKSKLEFSVALPSLPASPSLCQALASASHYNSPVEVRLANALSLRSEANSPNDAISPTIFGKDHRPSKSPTRMAVPTISASPEKAAHASSSALSPPATNTFSNSDFSSAAAQPLSMSPSPVNGVAEPLPQRPNRPGRPTLTRLNTSEMLRTQTSSALEPALAPARPNGNRRSPTALKLQLDTSVPRRSATMSSYPHANRPNQRAMLQPPPPLLSPATPARTASMTEFHDAPASASGSRSSANALEARTADPHLARSNFSFEEFEFQISTILPDFLYLGPNVPSEQAVDELKGLGVRRILNVACEIDELGPLQLRDRFGRYLKLPMLDSVEAKGVQDSIEQACSFLDDARLRSEPVYVHCKAGKSRSVTIVIAYLIHALGWTLQRSHSYVAERRADICPNIGFVAELMRYEEKELKLARSTGIYGDPAHVAAQSTPALVPSMSNDQPKAAESAPSLALHAARDDAHAHLNSIKDSSAGATLSQSSPDLLSSPFSQE
ncbi:hypothetical protein EX895_003375 [Sporisorium graminicola]|uniref:protein-tyrosine-phosphatase n=1 Tax=Sporisorium graminicola TaxID=280036 RepID=A0A4U7KTC2_9BASI|nr:hypothetical protein EX895_003375 [Sporisorium graminicola]TKY87794.1 hypothetical protein EX895_003375 [Sporisorium graminicola]